MRRSRQARAKEFSEAEKEEIYVRDGGRCIFCRQQYHMEDTSQYGRQIMDYMHYIARSHGGMGIAANGALGCRDHHNMMDNGNKGRHGEMQEIMKVYLKDWYPGWDEAELVYDKRKFG